MKTIAIKILLFFALVMNAYLGNAQQNALNFDGVDDEVIFTNSKPQINTLQQVFTLEAWVKPEVYSGNQPIIAGLPGTGGFELSIKNGKPAIAVYLDGLGWQDLQSADSVTLNRWCHLAAVYNRSTRSLKLYTNGSLDTSRVLTFTLTGTIGNIVYPASQALVLGHSQIGTSSFYKGSMDELRIWSFERSSSAISLWFNDTVPSLSAGLLGYYRFNTGVAGANNAGLIRLYGASPTSFIGTLNSFALNGAGSNWVESFAMAVPTNLNTSGVSQTGFMAHWMAPKYGAINNYVVELADNPDFTNHTTFFTTDTFYQFSNLSGGPFYFRVWANHPSIPSLGAYMPYPHPVYLLISISSFNPPSAQAGETIVIRGKNFTPGVSVKFDAVPASNVQVLSPDSLTATVPASNGPRTIGVIINSSFASKSGFNIGYHPGEALSFDGINDSVVIADHNALDIATAITLEAWIKPANVGAGTQSIIAKSANPAVGTHNGYSLQIDNGMLVFYLHTGSWQGLTAPTPFLANRWYHVAATYDGTTMRMFINGQQVITKSVGGAITTNNNSLLIGAQRGYGQFFAGQMDEIRMWSRARSQTELQAGMWNAADPQSTNLAAYYNFNSSWYDLTPNNLVASPFGGSFVNSEAMLRAQLPAPDNISPLGYTARWVVPNTASSVFTEFQTTNNPSSWGSYMPVVVSAGTTTSRVIAVTPGSTPHYRVRLASHSMYSEVMAVPIIYHVSPPTLTADSLLTIKGSNLYGASSVIIDGVSAASFTIVDSSTIIATVDSAGGTGDIQINTNGRGSPICKGIFVGETPGNALSFDGANDAVSIPYHPVLSFTNSLTIEAWVKVYNTSGDQALVCKSTSTEHTGYNLSLRNGKVVFWLHINGTWQETPTGDTLLANRWYHIAATYNGSAARIYINGKESAMGSFPGSITTNGQNLSIGCQPGYGQYLLGEMDDLRIWNTVRTPAQLQQGMSSEVSTQSIGLLAYYTFDVGTAGGDNSGRTVLSNMAGVLHHGTLNGFALNGASSNWVESLAGIKPVISPTSGSAPNSIFLRWSPPARGGFTDYKVYISKTNVFKDSAAMIALDTFLTYNSALPLTKYYCWVLATKNGLTCLSEPFEIKTTAHLPGNALIFDGSNDEVSIPYNNKLDLSTALTLEAWVKPVNHNGNQNFICKLKQPSPAGYNLRIENGKPKAYLYFVSGGLKGVVGPDVLPLNTWTHLAVTYNGSAIILFVNGKQVSGIPASGLITTSDDKLGLGCYPGSGEYFNGSMDEVRIWNTARSAAQIATGMSDTVARNTPGLVAYYHFDETEGTLLKDIGPNTFNGNMNGFSANCWVPSEAIKTSGFYPAVLVNSDYCRLFWSTAKGVNNIYRVYRGYTNAFGGATAFDYPDTTTLMNVPSGNTAYFWVRLGNSGRISDPISYTSPEKPPGNALHFDGINDSAITTYDSKLNVTTTLTLEAWVKPNAFAGDRPVIAKSSSANHTAYNLAIRNGTVILFLHINGTWRWAQTSDTLKINSWNHIAATYNGSVIRVYINGAEKATANFAGTITTNTQGLSLGCQPGFAQYFAGEMDEVRVWNIVRSQNQIYQGMSDTLARNTSGLVAYYNFDRGIPGSNNTFLTTVSDLTGNGLHGTPGGFALSGSTSNLIQSHALIIPKARPATSITQTGFLANWDLPVYRTDLSGGYTLQVASDSLFATIIQTHAISAGINTYSITALTVNTTYYYRIKANNNGCYSNRVKVNTLSSPPGNAIDFSGANASISIPSSSSLNNIASALTLEAWIRPFNQTGTQQLLSKNTTAENSGYELKIQNGYLVFGVIIQGQTQWEQLNAVNQVQTGRWQHVAATYDGSAIRLFINGLLVNQKAVTGSITTNNNPLTIGNKPGTLMHYKGAIDEVRIWNIARTEAQLKASLRNIATPETIGMVACYNFDRGEAAGNNADELTLYDGTPNANHGILQNFTLTGNSSNWVESYAMAVPVITAIANNTGNSVTLFWNNPLVGSVDSFWVDYSTDSTFGTYHSVSGNSGIIITAPIGQFAYYARVRANKTSVNNQGAYSETYRIPVIYAMHPATTVPGDTVTLYGKNFAPATLVRFSGSVAAILHQTDTLVKVRVPAMGAYGTITLNNLIGSSAPRLGFYCSKPPGNSINTDLTNDSIVISHHLSFNFTNAFSIECWIKGGSTASWIDKGSEWQVNIASSKYVSFVTNSLSNTTLTGTKPVTDGSWHHIALVYDGTAKYIYVDGKLDVSAPASGTLVTNANPIKINPFKGSMDELRFWTKALTPLKINAHLIGSPDSRSDGLVAYYSFDWGTAGANNASMNQVYDIGTNQLHGQLHNFTLSGTTSNWVGSAAMVVSATLPSNQITTNSFIAKWEDPGNGVVTGYYLDVATDSLFVQKVTGYNNLFVGNAITYLISGLVPNTRYYYRVRVYTSAGTCAVNSNTGQVLTLFNPPGNALHFDGTNDHVSIPDNPSLNITATITLEAWIKPHVGTATQVLIGKSRSGQNTGYQIKTTNNWQSMYFSLYIEGAWRDLIVPFSGIGSWHHVAATYDGSNMYLYIDGTLRGFRAQTGLITNNTSPLYIGTWPPVSVNFAGAVDEVRVWNVVRSASEINAGMRDTLAPGTSGLVAYYHFDQGFAGNENTGVNTLTDKSGNNLHGTLNDFANTGTSSNWVESYALMIPVTKNPAVVSLTSFNASWLAPLHGEVSNYLVDVATDSNFNTLVYKNLYSLVTGISINSLSEKKVYYYRVRAYKAALGDTSGYSASMKVTTLGRPQLTDFNPKITGLEEPLITLKGQNLLTVIKVYVGGQVASVIHQTDTSMLIQIEPGTVSGNIIVLGPASDTINGFTFVKAPTISSFSPQVISVPGWVTLNGTSFEEVRSVHFGGRLADSIQVISITQLKAWCSGGLTGAIKLATGGGIVSKPGFVYTMETPGNTLSFTAPQYPYVMIPNHSSLNPNTGLTLEAWIKPEFSSYNNLQVLMCKSNSIQNTAYQLKTLDNWQHLYFSLHIGGSWREFAVPFPGVGGWHHIAATYDGANMRIYIDGVLSGTMPQTGPVTTNTSPLYIGTYVTPSPGYFYLGKIDEMRIWNTARSEAQIKASLKDTVGVNSSNLAAYYRFDQGVRNEGNAEADSLMDYTANKNNGKLNKFLLSGNTSNWLESYAMMTPASFTLSAATINQFTASWTAPPFGNVSNYRLQVSTTKNFITYQHYDMGTSLSKTVKGLAQGTKYYCRILTSKAGLSDTAYSAIDSITTLSLPVINSFSPTTAGPGMKVTIAGGNFTTTPHSVKFGGTNAASFSVNAANDTITAYVASGSTGAISVTTIAGTANLPGFTYVNKPLITNVTPLKAATGDTVFISGTNLTNATISLGGTIIATPIISTNLIKAVIGSGASGVVKVSTPGGVDSLAGFIYMPITTWTGSINTDWNNPSNWNNGVPDSNKKVIIPKQPIRPVQSGTIILGSFILSDVLLLNGTIRVTETFENRGTISGGVIELAGTSAQTIYGNGTIENLTINNAAGVSISPGNIQTITGSLALSSGTFTTNGNLVLASTATQTARIASIPAGADITGNVTVQRYVPPITRRSRMLSSPQANFSCAQFIDDIFISGPGGVSNGFDASTSNGHTIYTYQESTTGGRGWKPISNINNTINAGLGALVFIRGDRTLPSPQWYTPPYVIQNQVTIDYENQAVNKGTISPTITYTNTGEASNDGWNMVGNPYPSQINWHTITKHNLSPFYYVLNPQTGSYVADDGSNPIASGQGFFVQALGISPSISFTESCKTDGTATSYFKTAVQSFSAFMIKDSLNADMLKIAVASGSSAGFKSSEDALKMTNSLINFGILANQDSFLLQYSNMPEVVLGDTVKLYVDAGQGNYTLTFPDLIQFNSSLDVFLHDAFTSVTKDLRADSVYSFSITAHVASKGNNRFTLILKPSTSLPLTFTKIQASVINHADVKISWQTIAEKNVSHFIVDRLISNQYWKPLATVPAQKDNQLNRYAYTDLHAWHDGDATLYYRLRAIDKDGTENLSNVVSVSKTRTHNQITLYPNPGGIWFTVKGINLPYQVSVYDLMGQMVYNKHNISGQEKFYLNELADGVYLVVINDVDSNVERFRTKWIKNSKNKD